MAQNLGQLILNTVDICVDNTWAILQSDIYTHVERAKSLNKGFAFILRTEIDLQATMPLVKRSIEGVIWFEEVQN